MNVLINLKLEFVRLRADVQELRKSGERVGTRIGAGGWKGGVDGF
jgi:hypothetical protein